MKLDIRIHGGASGETLERNRARSFGDDWRGTGTLAVIGGGSSVASRLNGLRKFKGDIFAINGAHKWCNDQGIHAIFFSADPGDEIADMCRGQRSVLADHCAPGAFESASLVWRIKCESFGPSSAATLMLYGPRAGYRKLVFYGCESSWKDTTHAYEDKPGDWLCVQCGPEKYITNMALLAQAEMMSEVIRAAPSVFEERSGGLLRAMVDHGGEFEALYGDIELVNRINEAAAA